MPQLVVPWHPVLPAPPEDGPGPRLLLVNDALADDLDIDAEWLRSDEALHVLGARVVLPGSVPVAQAYAGHQFGSYSPLLGDGRAVVLGELRDRDGQVHDVALKGSGRTVFSRGGDGRAVLGPVLREYVLGEAMHALGVPTTRALAVVTTGDRVLRDGSPMPGAVLTRVAASHLRVGTFEAVARSMAPEAAGSVLPQLTRYALERHPLPGAAPPEDVWPGDGSALALLAEVVSRQARLVAHWQSVGFVHGVMNTDNTTISGQTIDYGPCAWLEEYDEAAVFSSIDAAGRYRFGHQPRVMMWNLARLAEAVLPLVDADPETAVAAATEVLSGFEPAYRRARHARLCRKLGLRGDGPDDAQIVDDFVTAVADAPVDYTLTFRRLAQWLRRPDAVPQVLLGPWPERWRAALGTSDVRSVADAMDAVNPAYVARNHLVEHALQAAVESDLAPVNRLLDAVRRPYAERPGLEELVNPAPPGFTGSYVTFCGT